MKFVWLIGNAAVGKMTVGQELMKLTGLRLFHNHMMIEPVIELFGEYKAEVTLQLREILFKEFAKSNQKGIIFTYMWAFDQTEDWKYVKHIESLFDQDTEFYYVELIASQQERLKRNQTENRLSHKPSKRDINASHQRLLHDDLNYRCVSNIGEIPFKYYLRIDNTALSAKDVAQQIQKEFHL